jgi:hypothetical protein
VSGLSGIRFDFQTKHPFFLGRDLCLCLPAPPLSMPILVHIRAGFCVVCVVWNVWVFVNVFESFFREAKETTGKINASHCIYGDICMPRVKKTK